jgi:hypothetical protein
MTPGREGTMSDEQTTPDGGTNMLDLLDLHHPAFLTPPALAKPLVETDPGALSCDVTGPGTIPPPGSVTPPKH